MHGYLLVKTAIEDGDNQVESCPPIFVWQLKLVE